jgi:hypothetical protein
MGSFALWHNFNLDTIAFSLRNWPSALLPSIYPTPRYIQHQRGLSNFKFRARKMGVTDNDLQEG